MKTLTWSVKVLDAAVCCCEMADETPGCAACHSESRLAARSSMAPLLEDELSIRIDVCGLMLLAARGAMVSTCNRHQCTGCSNTLLMLRHECLRCG